LGADAHVRLRHVASPLQPFVKAALILLMALGSVILWIGSPLGWLWIASQMQKDSSENGFGPYAVVLFGIAITGVAMAKLLQRLNRLYGEVDGAGEPVRVVLPWHRGLRGENEGRPQRTVLDVVMVISVFFAGSSLPAGAAAATR
jgi:hypothetical protein